MDISKVCAEEVLNRFKEYREEINNLENKLIIEIELNKELKRIIKSYDVFKEVK